MVTSSMKDITVYAYLTDFEGNMLDGTNVVFNYKFEDILIPQFSTTDLVINNDYPNDRAKNISRQKVPCKSLFFMMNFKNLLHILPP